MGGWLFRGFGVSAPDAPAEHVLVAFVGASALLLSLRGLRRATFVARSVAPAEAAPTFAELEQMIGGLGQLERRIFKSLLTQRPIARDPNQRFESQSTFGERVADKVAQFGGSWTFIGLFFIGMISWMAMNQEMTRSFDPYPFILLNLVLSCLAALQAPIIMMSQNRQSAKDRSDAKNDYEVNVRAELQIIALHAKLDAMRDEEIRRLSGLVEQQRSAIDALETTLGARERTEPVAGPSPASSEP